MWGTSWHWVKWVHAIVGKSQSKFPLHYYGLAKYKETIWALPAFLWLFRSRRTHTHTRKHTNTHTHAHAHAHAHTHTHARTHTLAFSPVRIFGFFFFQVWSLTPRHTQASCPRGPRFESRPHSPSVSPTPFLSHHYCPVNKRLEKNQNHPGHPGARRWKGVLHFKAASATLC